MTVPKQKQMSTDEFLKKVRDDFEDSFEFPFLHRELLSVRSRITMVCALHGEIKKSAAGILYRKTGCPKCASLRQTISQTTNTKHANEMMIRFYRFVRDPENDINREYIARCNWKPYYCHLIELYNQFLLRAGPVDFTVPTGRQ